VIKPLSLALSILRKLPLTIVQAEQDINMPIINYHCLLFVLFARIILMILIIIINTSIVFKSTHFSIKSITFALLEVETLPFN
jgi:predicted membrane chloride channel (bestrophin family)